MARRSPTSRSRQGPGTSWIVDERERPGLPPWWFVLGVLLLGAGVTAATVVLGVLRGDLTHGEQIHIDAGGAWGIAIGFLGYSTMRVLMGVVAGATVIATGFVARRFTHHGGMGILAAVLVALDPALLVDGQLALPAALIRFAAVSSLAMALGGHPLYHWLVPLPLIVGIILEPWFVAWGVVIALLLLFRGHIFAAPKHLREAFLQGLGTPLLIAVPLLIAIRATTVTESVVCAPSLARSVLLLDTPHYAPGLVALSNPVVVIGGLGVLAALTIGAVVQVASTFRLARLPGRIQVRLPSRLGRTPSRALWLLAFAVVIPAPQVAVVVGAVAIALGVQALMVDSPMFGAVIGITTAAFALLVVVRLAVVIGGTATPAELTDVLQWLPWVEPYTCGIVK